VPVSRLPVFFISFWRSEIFFLFINGVVMKSNHPLPLYALPPRLAGADGVNQIVK
jgi:hypothetical protein